MLYVILDTETNIVIQAGVGTTLPPGAVQVTSPIPVDELAQMWWDGEELILRPEITAPSVAGNVVTIHPVPLSTVIEVADVTGEEIMLRVVTEVEGYTETITLPDPGTYQVDVQAPLPYLPVSRRVVVA